MSADNYIFVRKREDGQFGVSMRFASGYYPDVDDAEQHELWGQPDDRYGVFVTVEEALVAAHKAYQAEPIVEYGVIVGKGVV